MEPVASSRYVAWGRYHHAELSDRGDTIHLGPRVFTPPGNITGNAISSRCRRVFDEHHVRAAYHPVKIFDRMGKLTSTDHVSFVPLDEIDCLEIEASKVDLWGPNGGLRVDRWARREDLADGAQIADARRIVIREDAIPPNLKLFCLRFHRRCVLLSSTFAALLASLDDPATRPPAPFSTMPVLRHDDAELAELGV